MQTCTYVASAAGSTAVTVCILILSVQAGANMYVRSKCSRQHSSDCVHFKPIECVGWCKHVRMTYVRSKCSSDCVHSKPTECAGWCMLTYAVQQLYDLSNRLARCSTARLARCSTARLARCSAVRLDALKLGAVLSG